MKGRQRSPPQMCRVRSIECPTFSSILENFVCVERSAQGEASFATARQLKIFVNEWESNSQFLG